MRYYLLNLTSILNNTFKIKNTTTYFLSKTWVFFFREAFLFDYLYKIWFLNFSKIWIFYNINLFNTLILNYSVLRFFNKFFSNNINKLTNNTSLNWFKSFNFIFKFFILLLWLFSVILFISFILI